MSIAFNVALALVIWHGAFSVRLLRLHSEAKREFFGRALTEHLKAGWILFRLVITSFLLALVFMGPVKLWLFNITTTTQCSKSVEPHCQQLSTADGMKQQYFSCAFGWIISLGGTLALAEAARTMRAASDHVMDLVNHKQSEVPEGCTRDDSYHSAVRHNSAIRASALTFQTGNVFYEVLFTVINPDGWIQDVWYLVFSVLTLCLGSIGILMGSAVVFWLDHMPTRSMKNTLAFHLRPMVRTMLYLHIGSLITWLVAMVASSSVKYPRHWYFSAVLAIPALAAILITWYFIARTQQSLPAADGRLSADGVNKLQKLKTVFFDSAFQSAGSPKKHSLSNPLLKSTMTTEF